MFGKIVDVLDAEREHIARKDTKISPLSWLNIFLTDFKLEYDLEKDEIYINYGSKRIPLQKAEIVEKVYIGNIIEKNGILTSANPS